MPAIRRTKTSAATRIPNGSLAVSTPTRVTTHVGAQSQRADGPRITRNDNTSQQLTQPQAIAQLPTGSSQDPRTTQDYLAIIADQQRRIQVLVNRDLARQLQQDDNYPIRRPSFAKGSEYRLPCTRLVLGLRYFPGDRGMINRRIWNEMQATTRAVISASTMYDKIPSDAVWKRLSVSDKKYLKDQLVKIISKTEMHREVLFVNGDPERNKFYAHWPLERMIMSALSTDRTAAHNKDVAMAQLDDSLTAMRLANNGHAAWLGKEIRCIKRDTGGPRGRPSLNGHLSEEESEDQSNNFDSDLTDME